MPPDLVFFDRFAIGEWASKHALEDLTPYVEAQDAAIPNRIDLADYYPWAVDERATGRRARPSRAGSTASLLWPTSACSSTNLDLVRQEG